MLGPLPREWRWGLDLLPVVLRRLSELQWLALPPAEERHPRAHWQVSFMELAIDFEAYAGRQLPPAPQSRFQGGDMTLQEKARVMRLITTLLGRSVGKESILLAKLTNNCKSLIPMGAGAVMGLEGRPLLTKPLDVAKHLQRLRKYGEERWAQRQRLRQAKHRAEHGKKQARSAEQPRAPAGDRPWCPVKGGAKAGHFAADFYTRPVGRPKESFEVGDGAQVEVQGLTRLAMAFTPLRIAARTRKPETHKRRTKTRICEPHGHPPCRACATTHRGVRYCCSRGHQGHPRVPTECPMATSHTPARVLGCRRISQWTPMGRGGAERHPPAPKRRVMRTPTSRGPPRGVQGAPNEAGRG